MQPFQTDENGEFQIAVIPGRGILGARSPVEPGTGWQPGSKTSRGCTRGGSQWSLRYPAPILPMNFNTLVEIDPRPGEESVTVDIGLDRGRTLKGKLVGPDGEPVAGALMMGAEDFYETWSERPLPTAEFEVHALGYPAEARAALLSRGEAPRRGLRGQAR